MRQGTDNVDGATALLDAIQTLGRRARLAGMHVSPAQLARLVRAAGLVDVTDRASLRRVVRLCLSSSAQDGATLDALVDLTFPAPPNEATSVDHAALSADIGRALQARDERALAAAGVAAADLAPPGAGAGDGRDARDGRTVRYLEQRVLRALDLSGMLQQAFVTGAEGLPRQLASSEAREGIDVFGEALLAELRLRAAGTTNDQGDEAAMLATYLDADVADISLLSASPRELAALRAALRPLARKLAARARRRTRARRGRLAVGPTLRRGLSTGGVPVEPVFRQSRARRPRLVVLCDVSGSMAEVSRFTLTLLHALHAELPLLRAFAFLDGVAEITDLLAAGDGLIDARVLMSRPGLVAGDGHSDYGAAFARFLDGHGRSLGRTSTVVVIGDARVRGLDPGVAALRALRGRVRNVLWCNPEPRADWDTGDSRQSAYRAVCSSVDEIGTLRQLAEWVDRLTAT